MTVLVSHLGHTATERLVAKLAGDPPNIVLLATGSDRPGPPEPRFGSWWVPLARRGRSLAVITVRDVGQRPAIEIEQRLVTSGPVTPAVQGWVDDYYARLRAGQAEVGPDRTVTFPPVNRCESCHQVATTAWRAHPHARAVEALEAIGRDVASCLRCHSEALRRDGLRPPSEGDRGVQCATCHAGLEGHLADPAESKLSTFTEEDCRACHNPENSPAWDGPRYWASVVEACRGNTGGLAGRGGGQ